MMRRSPVRTSAAALAALALIVSGASTASAAPLPLLVPPPDVSATGASGSVELTPVLGADEYAIPRTDGLGEPEVTASVETLSDGPDTIFATADEFTADDSALVFTATSADPVMRLQIDVTFIEQGDLEPTAFPPVTGTGSVQFAVLPGYGQWLASATQLTGAAGVAVDLVTTTAHYVAPLTLTPARVDASHPTLTAGWSGLDPDRPALAVVQWDWHTGSVVMVNAGTPPPPEALIETGIDATLSSRLQRAGRTTVVYADVDTADGSAVLGDVEVRIDGVLNRSVEISAPRDAVRIPVGALPRGLHRIQVSFAPTDGRASPSPSVTRGVLAL